MYKRVYNYVHYFVHTYVSYRVHLYIYLHGEYIICNNSMLIKTMNFISVVCLFVGECACLFCLRPKKSACMPGKL